MLDRGIDTPIIGSVSVKSPTDMGIIELYLCFKICVFKRQNSDQDV